MSKILTKTMVYFKNSIFALVLVGALATFIPCTADAAWEYFGGQIDTVKLCLFPPGISFILKDDEPQTVAAADALAISLKRINELIFFPGISWWVAFPPSHPGQYVLGMAWTETKCFTRIRRGRLKGRKDAYLVFLIGATP